MAAEMPAAGDRWTHPTPRQWPLFAVLAAYFHVLMEWLFFATKPSFLSLLGFEQQVAALFGTAAMIAIPAAIPPLAIAACARWGPAWVSGRSLAVVGLSSAAGVLAASFFLLIDNFSYTVFHFGVLTTAGPLRWGYAFLFAALFAAVLRRMLRIRMTTTAERGLRRLAQALLLVSCFTGIVQYAVSSGYDAEQPSVVQHGGRMPNVLLLASDGVEASHMSAYGAERDTTPYIMSLKSRALVAENAFPNATVTAGSVVAMLTSKLPTHTRLYHYENILTGRDSYEHLPGLLRDAGYRSIHVSHFLWADPTALPRPWNMQNAFDEYEGLGTLPPELAIAYSANVYFFAQLVERVLERMRHSVGIGREQRKFEQLLSAGGTTDSDRIDVTLDFMEASERPTFAHLHLMATHEPYRPRKAFFSGGTTKLERTMDAYDSTIRTFDEHVETIVERLRASGRLENTIIVLSSDHGRRWAFGRIPLMFLFPGGAHRGVIRANVSLLDVAPTLLDFLGMPIPAWMEGQSLLAGVPDRLRQIQSVRVSTLAKAPYPMVAGIALTVCNRTVWFAPRKAPNKVEWVEGHTDPCRPGALPDPAKALAMLVYDLEPSGYDVSHLRSRSPSRRPDKPGG
ncbi:MAG: sulfatase [Deltaproteobacteria bacterium]|nr:sulfatase [Deltaproteobacteria bacterium]